MHHTFMNVDIVVGPGVLVPRAETELLGYTALDLLGGIASPRIIDMCCGSGNLALAVATARPDARIYASDLTPETVATARDNAARLGLTDRVTIVQGDMFSGLAELGLEGSIDLVLCNPPYISTGKLEKESAHLLDAEPREAFDAGPFGIAIQQRLINECQTFLRPGGLLAFEFGIGQDRQAKALLARARAFAAPSFRVDADDVPRVLVAQKL